MKTGKTYQDHSGKATGNQLSRLKKIYQAGKKIIVNGCPVSFLKKSFSEMDGCDMSSIKKRVNISNHRNPGHREHPVEKYRFKKELAGEKQAQSHHPGRKHMLKKLFLAGGVLLILFLPVSCIQTGEMLLHKASQAASDQFVQQMKTSARWDQVKQVGVYVIENDSPRGSMRETLHNALVRHTIMSVVGMDEMSEKEKILSAEATLLKYKRHYDSDTLVKIGQKIGLRTMVIGRVISHKKGLRSGYVHFQGQVLDLEQGTILCSDAVEGTYYKPLTKQEAGIDILILILVFGIVSGLSRHAYFYGKDFPEKPRRRMMQAIAALGTLSLFVLYYLVFA